MNLWFCALHALLHLKSPNAAGVQIDVALSACACRAMSREDAMQQGLEAALNEWPSNAGWFGHAATARLIDREELAFAYESAGLEQTAQREGQVIGADPERIM